MPETTLQTEFKGHGGLTTWEYILYSLKSSFSYENAERDMSFCELESKAELEVKSEDVVYKLLELVVVVEVEVEDDEAEAGDVDRDLGFFGTGSSLLGSVPREVERRGVERRGITSRRGVISSITKRG